MDRSTTVLLRDLEDDQKSRAIQELPLSIFRQFSSKRNGPRARSLTSILRRSISDSVERNLCHRVGLHQVFNYRTTDRHLVNITKSIKLGI